MHWGQDTMRESISESQYTRRWTSCGVISSSQNTGPAPAPCFIHHGGPQEQPRSNNKVARSRSALPHNRENGRLCHTHFESCGQLRLSPCRSQRVGRAGVDQRLVMQHLKAHWKTKLRCAFRGGSTRSQRSSAHCSFRHSCSAAHASGR